jgi:hypothetical protein
VAYRALADLLVGIHLAFILFVIGGGFAALRWPRLAWIHLPAAAWGAAVELGGWICPLTPLESRLRQLGGAAGYTGSFVERHLLPLIYPAALTRELQVALGVGVLALNVAAYTWLWRRRVRAGPTAPQRLSGPR